MFMKIGPETRLIISTSGRMSSLKRYQKLLQEVLQLDIAYVPIISDSGKIEPEKFAGAIRGMSAIGGAISKDIKNKIIPHLDQVDEVGKKVNAVNTVIRKGNRLIGYNLDAFGFRKAIEKGIADSGINIRTAVVYGYGGVFNVVYHVLNEMDIEVCLTGRRPEAVQERAAAFGIEAFDGHPKDLFVNATPVSDAPLKEAKNFLEALRGSKMAFDHQMPGDYLRRYCEENNICHLPGTAMYYPQMYKQWTLFLEDHIDTDKLPEQIAEAEKLAR